MVHSTRTVRETDESSSRNAPSATQAFCNNVENLDIFVRPSFTKDPQKQNYTGHSSPILPLSEHDMSSLRRQFREKRGFDTERAIEASLQLERTWRILRWAKFYNYNLIAYVTLGCLSSATLKAVVDKIEANFTNSVLGGGTGDSIDIEELYGIVRDAVNVDDCEDGNVQQALERAEKLKYEDFGSPTSFEAVRSYFIHAATCDIQCRLRRQEIQCLLMNEWWELYDSAGSDMIAAINPFEALHASVRKGKYLHLDDEGFQRMLSISACNPRTYCCEWRDRGWPGFYAYNSVITQRINGLLKNTGFTIDSPIIQNNPAWMMFACSFVPTVICDQAFFSSFPENLKELMHKISTIQYSRTETCTSVLGSVLTVDWLTFLRIHTVFPMKAQV